MSVTKTETVTIEVDGRPLDAEEGATILQTLRHHGLDLPTLCHYEGLTPASACRACVVEIEGARTLVPACSRPVQNGMKIRTNSERVRQARKMVFELLASAVDISTYPELQAYMREHGADPARFGDDVARVSEPVREDNLLYVRDHDKCILCYRCVEVCGEDAQFTFALSVAGRGFQARVDTGAGTPLPDSRCVFCGNCVAVCPTGALMPSIEHRLRQDGTWDESRQQVTTTTCPYCGVGCPLELHVQDNRIVKVTSPRDHPVTYGNLCVKGRFGFAYVEGAATPPAAPVPPAATSRD